MALMPANKPRRPRVIPGVVLQQASTPESTERALGDIADRVNALASAPRAVHTVDLIVGANRIAHGLGRKARGATVTPTTADAGFAWSFSVDGERIAIITVIGVAQTGATVEIY